MPARARHERESTCSGKLVTLSGEEAHHFGGHRCSGGADLRRKASRESGAGLSALAWPRTLLVLLQRRDCTSSPHKASPELFCAPPVPTPHCLESSNKRSHETHKSCAARMRAAALMACACSAPPTPCALAAAAGSAATRPARTPPRRPRPVTPAADPVGRPAATCSPSPTCCCTGLCCARRCHRSARAWPGRASRRWARAERRGACVAASCACVPVHPPGLASTPQCHAACTTHATSRAAPQPSCAAVAHTLRGRENYECSARYRTERCKWEHCRDASVRRGRARHGVRRGDPL